MASPGNPNQPGGPFDLPKFFNPTPPNPSTSNLGSSPFQPPSAYPQPPSASFPPPSGPYSYPPQTTQFHHPQFQLPPFSQQQDHPPTSLHQQRSLPYPAPSLPPSNHHIPPQNPNAGARLMALLSAPASTLEVPHQMPMAPIQPPPSGSSEFPVNPGVPALHFATPLPNANVMAAPMRMLSSKLPRGRHLVGDHVTYNIDMRLEGEVQPQLEVTPITKYASDPGLVLGRQIAVNKSYICYGLKMGAIRVLNINTALRSLLKGLAQRVTDMAFFAEDVHLLASASVDGRIYVWKISEGPDEDEKPQITGNISVAIQIVGEGESVHPRVCWHCHKQEILVVGIGNHVLKIDTTKVGKGKVYSAEEPLKCTVDNLIAGVQFVGKHEGVVTDLSMCQWMTTRLVSASTDGTIKIWDDRKAQPLAVLRPHEGRPVNFVTFMTAPDRPDHIILITAGPLNREVKIWVSAGEEGWLLPSDAESWHCTQTLELKSSTDSRPEDVFFNQISALSEAGLILLANAKKNAIYAVHLEYGPNPATTQMDYIAEFTVTMPILSFTGTSDLLPHGDHIVQVYCVQTQAIQQYALELSQCLPPPLDNMVLEKSDSGVIHHVSSSDRSSLEPSSGSKPSNISLASSAPKPSTDNRGSESVFVVRHPVSSALNDTAISAEFATQTVESRPSALPSASSNNDISHLASPPLPLSPKLSGKLNGFRSPAVDSDSIILEGRGGEKHNIEHSLDKNMNNVRTNLSSVPSVDREPGSDENNLVRDDISSNLNHPVTFKHPTHLVTPSEILMATSSSEPAHFTEQKKSDGEPTFQDMVVNSNVHTVEVEVKVVGETGFNDKNEMGSREEPRDLVRENKDKVFCSQASDLGIEMARECHTLSSETYIVEDNRQLDGGQGNAESAQFSTAGEPVHAVIKGFPETSVDSSKSGTVQQPEAPIVRGKKTTVKNIQGVDPSSPSTSIAADSSSGLGVGSSSSSTEVFFSQIMSMQEMLNELTAMQKEMQKQMNAMVTAPVTKEGKRLEAALGKSLEKSLKANTDALWARFQEENAKQEKIVRDRTQQASNLISNCITKDLPAMVEKTIKKEISVVGPAVARTISPTIEKTVSTAISEAFQRGVGDKAVNQLEKSVNSKLETTIARQIQTQFQTSGRQALQESLMSTLEASVIPSFEKSCKAMFEQVDSTFQKGLVEHATAAQKQFESAHSPLALALRDAINSASSMTQTLSGEFAEGQKKLFALAAAGASSKAVNPLVTQLSNGPLSGLHDKIEDPTKELSRLISERKYEEAFTTALQRSDVSIVSWLCSQVGLQGLVSMVPLPLSQGVLLSLLQQLACDMSKDSANKLAWMRDVALAINPTDPMIAMHVRPIFEQVYQILNHHSTTLPTTSVMEVKNIRLVMHVINSMLMTCK